MGTVYICGSMVIREGTQIIELGELLSLSSSLLAIMLLCIIGIAHYV